MRRTFALSVLALMVVAGNAFALGEARVQGKIIDGATHKPIPFAVITIDATSGHTVHSEYKADKDGVYRFLVLDATLSYKFTFKAPGYANVEQVIKLAIGDLTTKDVTMAPASAQTAAAAPAAVKADPAVLAYNEGAELANAGKDSEAIAKIEAAVTAKPDLTAGYEALAKLYLRAKNYDKAIDRANKALEIDSDNQDMFGVLSEAYTAKGDKVKAGEYRKKLPADAASMFNEAAHLINSGKDAEAEPMLKGAIAANDKFAAAYYELGMLYVRTQKNADAKTNLQKYLELEPNGKDAATAKEMLNYVK
ncbi:MAG TPA: carboxypeptidase regulatory-like domain-containing protein [Thermoanaerobaculia bacterium]|nr:carboxypeptidase regulatory-like domain-containing protein [Thermoanaerobaculia bacterium]